RFPQRVVDMVAELDGDATENQQPQHHHECEIKSAKGRGVERREGEKQRPSSGQEPDLVAVPHRADRAENLSLFVFGPGYQELHDAGAEVEAIEDDVADYHGCRQAEPERSHYEIPPCARTASRYGWQGSCVATTTSGPRATSRMTRRMNSKPNSAYSPI